jgi:hypothetical protein
MSTIEEDRQGKFRGISSIVEQKNRVAALSSNDFDRWIVGLVDLATEL